MATCQEFPKDWHEFIKDASFKDSQEVYTNGSELIPVFRVEQLIEHLLKEQEAKIEQLNRFVNGFSRDAMPVVRCKDCYYSEHLDSYSVLDKQLFRCCHVSQIGQNEPKMHTGDWFCAYGQLKE